MRILKYIFLILILLFIGLTVFVTTQKGDFDITRSKVIKTPRSTVFNYINDYRNWETFGTLALEDKSMQFTYPDATSGIGAFYSWKGNDSYGTMKTIAVTENESIRQKMMNNNSPSEVFWQFKDTLGATKVTWRNKGKMDTMTKIYAFFNGGIDAVIGTNYEKSLANLDRTLHYELNTFSIVVNGITKRPKQFYIHQTINSYEDKVTKNIKIMLPKMISFFKKNKINMIDKPYVIYNATNLKSKIVNFSVCMPMRDSIYIMPGSEVSTGKIDAMTTLKTTLIGDYSHLKKAKIKAMEYIAKYNLKQNLSLTSIEVYSKTIQDIKNPSKWVTELYIPVFPKAVTTEPRVSKPKDSITKEKPVNETILPKVTNP